MFFVNCTASYPVRFTRKIKSRLTNKIVLAIIKQFTKVINLCINGAKFIKIFKN